MLQNLLGVVEAVSGQKQAVQDRQLSVTTPVC